VRQLALDITRDAETAYDKVVAIERWLSQLDYTREMVTPGAHEPLEHFLFKRREGHCEYFATALAILARAADVPTRNVNGFLGGEWNDFANYLAVRAGDAHSWVEIYFPGVGWVTFDPTPAAGVPGLERGLGGLLGSLRRFSDSLRFQWFVWVVEYDLHRQLTLFRGVADAVRSGADSAIASPAERARAWLAERKRPALMVVLIAAALLAAHIARRRLRRGRPGGRSPARKRSQVAAHYEAALRRLGRLGHGREPQATPREHARALLGGRAPGAHAFAELVELYYRAEYGGADDEASRQRAAELEAAIAAALRAKQRRRAA
jgi:protein-glutamine gamma-glutamyltransferase